MKAWSKRQALQFGWLRRGAGKRHREMRLLSHCRRFSSRTVSSHGTRQAIGSQRRFSAQERQNEICVLERPLWRQREEWRRCWGWRWGRQSGGSFSGPGAAEWGPGPTTVSTWKRLNGMPCGRRCPGRVKWWSWGCMTETVIIYVIRTMGIPMIPVLDRRLTSPGSSLPSSASRESTSYQPKTNPYFPREGITSW